MSAPGVSGIRVGPVVQRRQVRHRVDGVLIKLGMRSLKDRNRLLARAKTGGMFADAGELTAGIARVQSIFAIEDPADITTLLVGDGGADIVELPAADLVSRLLVLKQSVPTCDVVQIVLAEPRILLEENLGPRAKRGFRAIRRVAPNTNIDNLTAECPETMATVLADYLSLDSIRGVHPFLINWLRGYLGVR